MQTKTPWLFATYLNLLSNFLGLLGLSSKLQAQCQSIERRFIAGLAHCYSTECFGRLWSFWMLAWHVHRLLRSERIVEGCRPNAVLKCETDGKLEACEIL